MPEKWAKQRRDWNQWESTTVDRYSSSFSKGRRRWKWTVYFSFIRSFTTSLLSLEENRTVNTARITSSFSRATGSNIRVGAIMKTNVQRRFHHPPSRFSSSCIAQTPMVNWSDLSRKNLSSIRFRLSMLLSSAYHVCTRICRDSRKNFLDDVSIQLSWHWYWLKRRENQGKRISDWRSIEVAVRRWRAQAN